MSNPGTRRPVRAVSDKQLISELLLCQNPTPVLSHKQRILILHQCCLAAGVGAGMSEVVILILSTYEFELKR
jgi:hypothetical protein